jgi:hypothetical protein
MHRTYKITKMRMFATSEKVKPTITRFSLAAVKRTIIQVIRQPL